MRLPDRETSSKAKISSPLVAGSIDSNDSDPIDISRSSGSATSFADTPSASPTHSFTRAYSHRSLAGSHASRDGGRRHSVSRSVGSFVGSYEESILSGRMSATPSKPLSFTASIGVLGKGKCRGSLRCPPHLTVPFPAFFYSETSPYVGQIDVETADDENAGSGKRGYRIPPEGQLQVIIKNPNKTAVKLFLIPYNVSDMPALSKTFFRQKHYDAGDGDKLRYAIHIQICSPAQGKYYVHKAQRVVFANRVPDGKENLRVVIQGPTPAYTPWVPEKRQRKADQHARPDSREPKFIGGSLLDRDHDVVDPPRHLGGGHHHPDSPGKDGQLTPRPSTNQRSPLFQPRRGNYIRPPSSLSLGTPAISTVAPSAGRSPRDHSVSDSTSTSRHSLAVPNVSAGGGILGERLKALSIARNP